MSQINKKDIYLKCQQLLEEKIKVAKTSMEAAQASANNETKSSAGDKYETGRAMSQNERDMHAKQLSELLNQQRILTSIDPEKKLDKAETGALVETKAGMYFIGASLGLLQKTPKLVMAISPIAPIAQVLLDKQQGESFDWQGKSFEILSIE